VVSARASSEAIDPDEIVEYDDFTVISSKKKLETTKILLYQKPQLCHTLLHLVVQDKGPTSS
jgi:hypothetical protein